LSIQPVKSTTASQPLPSKHFWSRDLVSSRDLGPREVETVLNLAALMKARPADFSKSLAGKMMVMFFEKASLRTRLTFEAGMASLGGSTFFIDQTQERLGARETLADVAHNVERWVNAIVLRTYDQETIEQMADFASIPQVADQHFFGEHRGRVHADPFQLLEPLRPHRRRGRGGSRLGGLRRAGRPQLQLDRL